MKIPLNSPIAIPSAKATINVKHVLSVVLNTIALITPINAYIEPTDRSISPKRMIMNIPREDIPVMETCLSTLIIFEVVKKFCVIKAKIINSAANSSTSVSCRIISTLIDTPLSVFLFVLLFIFPSTYRSMHYFFLVIILRLTI